MLRLTLPACSMLAAALFGCKDKAPAEALAPTTTAPPAPAPPPATGVSPHRPDCTSGKECIEHAHEIEEADDSAGAARVLRRGCELHRSGESCFHLALLLHGTRGVAADHPEAQRLLGISCELGFPDACSEAGVNFIRGYGGRTDLAKAEELIKKACAGKSGIGCYSLGVITRDGSTGKTADLAQAIPQFQQACNYSYASGCNELGFAFVRGAGVAKNPFRAFELFEKACAMEARYCHNLGIALEKGDGTLKYPARARREYDKACGAGELAACNLLGYMKLDGDGGPKDVAGARALFKQTCDAGDEGGCEGLREPE